MENRKSPIYFYVFDLLQLNGKGLNAVCRCTRARHLSRNFVLMRVIHCAFRRARWIGTCS